MISMAMRTDRPSRTKNTRTTSPYESLEMRAKKSIEQNCPYAFCFRFLRFSSRNGVLTVQGCLPSFYLKQVLIAHLRRIEQLQRIDDQVDVISARGLSSEPQRSVA